MTEVETIPAEEQIPELNQPDFDALLADARRYFEEKSKSKYTLPQVLRDYRAVEGKPGIYLRAMCLGVEMRALELFDIYSDGSNVGSARVVVGIAAATLFRLNLPEDEAAARGKILDFARGKVEEDDLFEPVSEEQVHRLFKNSDELSDLVLKPLGINLKGMVETEEQDPNG